MNIAVVTANLGNFDQLCDYPEQIVPEGINSVDVFSFDDATFPPITGLSPRLQYRIPKLFSWEMVPGYDFYIWLDGSMSLAQIDSVNWLLHQMGNGDMAFFRHPWRKTISQEVGHIESKLQEGNEYIISRYLNGLHYEQLAIIQQDEHYTDNVLFASNVFIYRNNEKTRSALSSWWFYQSRYFTCDQVPLPWVLWNSDVDVRQIEGNVFKNEYISLTSKHK